MRSSKHVIRRPYVPGALSLRDVKPGWQPLGLWKQNMGLIQKSRKFFSNLLQSRADSDSENTAVKPQVSKSEGPRWTPLRGRAMRYANFRGKKRKRESDDGCFYRQKNRLLKGGEIKAVTEEEMDRDDLRCRTLLQILYPEIEAEGIVPKYWPTFAIEELENSQDCFEENSQDSFEENSQDSFEENSQDSFEENSQDSFEDLPSDLSCTLDNLTIIDDDDTVMRTPYTSSEGYNDSEISCMESISEWGDTYLARRRHSESSIEVPLCLDVVMNEFPVDSGRRSVPPQLDLAPSLTSQLTGFASLGHVPDVSDDDFLKELFGPWLEYRMEVPPGSEYSVEMSDEVQDVNTDARVKAEAGASCEMEMETEAGIEIQARAEREVEAGAGAGAGTETGFEPRMGTKLDETGTVTTVDEANVSKMCDEEIEETEMGEADASVSGEATGTTLEPEGTETAGYRTEMEEADKENTGAKEADDGERVRAYEAIPEDAMMEGLEETTSETTSETVYVNKATGEPEPRTPEPKTPEPRIPEPKTPTSATVAEPAPEPTSPTPAVPVRMSALKLAFRTVHSLYKQVGTIAEYDYGIDTCSRCQQIDLDMARRIRAVRERVMEELLVIEEGLRTVVECEAEECEAEE